MLREKSVLPNNNQPPLNVINKRNATRAFHIYIGGHPIPDRVADFLFYEKEHPYHAPLP